MSSQKLLPPLLRPQVTYGRPLKIFKDHEPFQSREYGWELLNDTFFHFFLFSFNFFGRFWFNNCINKCFKYKKISFWNLVFSVFFNVIRKIWDLKRFWENFTNLALLVNFRIRINRFILTNDQLVSKLT
jgi:hypothetical protein